MVKCRASSASPGGGGRGPGRGRGRGSAKRAAPADSPAASPTKRSKAGADEQSAPEAEVKGEELPRPWARLLAQCSKTPHLSIIGNQVLVGKDENRGICLDDQTASTLCILRHLERGTCELEVTGEDGQVYLNGGRLIKGTKVPLVGGDEVVFGEFFKHAYIFQHPLSDKITKAVPISPPALLESPMTNVKSIHLENRTGGTSAGAGCTILAPVPNHLGDQIAVPAASAGENKQGVEESQSESALENQSNCNRFLNPSASVSPSGSQTFKDVLKQGILSPNDIDVTLDNFPYYLSENTKNVLVSSAFIHMKRKEFTKHVQGISSLNQRILLSGPSGSEIYQEKLIKALAKHFDARFLVIDSLLLCGRSPKYQESIKHSRRNDATTSNSRFRIFWTQLPKQLSTKPKSNKNIFREADGLQLDSSVREVDSLSLGMLIEVISEEVKSGELIVLLKDVEKSFNKYSESHAPLRNELPPGVLIIGSHTEPETCTDQSHCGGVDLPMLFGSSNEAQLDSFAGIMGGNWHDRNKCATKSTEHLNRAFPNKISIELPQNEAQLSDLKKQLEHDTQTLIAEANVIAIRKFLSCKRIECDDLDELSIRDQLLTSEDVDKIVGSAVSYHFQEDKPNFIEDEKVVLPIKCLKHAISQAHNTPSGHKGAEDALKDVVTNNKFERIIKSNVITPKEIGVTFEDIGALDNVKDTLKELVMVPIQRPELFSKGQLRKPLKGILLFGPPGTGKTMLAKAVATEAGANIINISMSTITSKFVGEGEKYVKSIFSLASKLSPAVIFIDEVDSFLGRRESSGEHEIMRIMKNEFMINWDGLRTKEQERVLVLGATNRPFDLDEAVIRRFPRRLMVGLPDASNREKILRVILSKEELASDVDLESLANMTDGYSGSDLKNLCVTAAHFRVGEVINKEEKEKSSARAEGRPEPPPYGSEAIRALRMDDFKSAHGQVCASLSSDSKNMSKLVEWNNLYGEGGSRKNEMLTYFM